MLIRYRGHGEVLAWAFGRSAINNRLVFLRSNEFLRAASDSGAKVSGIAAEAVPWLGRKSKPLWCVAGEVGGRGGLASQPQRQRGFKRAALFRTLNVEVSQSAQVSGSEMLCSYAMSSISNNVHVSLLCAATNRITALIQVKPKCSGLAVRKHGLEFLRRQLYEGELDEAGGNTGTSSVRLGSGDCSLWYFIYDPATTVQLI